MAREMGEQGSWFKERMKIDGRPDYVLGNAALHQEIAEAGIEDIEKRNDFIRSKLRGPLVFVLAQTNSQRGDNVSDFGRRRSARTKKSRENDDTDIPF
jgi:hypothetical protein